MADRLEWFDVTIAANTQIANAVTIPMVFLDGEVVEIDVKVLDGPCGSVGFHINAGGSQYVPRTAGAFIRPNDDYFVWPIANAINSGSWGLTGYNLDSWDHNLQVGFHVNDRGLSLTTKEAQIGTSAGTFLSAATAMPASTLPEPDPLSVNSLLASVSPDVVTFLASQQAPSPEVATLTSTTPVIRHPGLGL